MKVLKIFFIIFLVIGVILAALVMTFDANKYRPQISGQISKALGREVGIEDINLKVSLDKGVALKVKNVAIADDKRFSDGLFLSAGSVWLNIDLMKFIQGQGLQVAAIEINSPVINLIENDNKELNVATISQPATSSDEIDRKDSSDEAIDLAVQSFVITDAKLTVKQHQGNIVRNITVDDFDFEASDIMQGESFPFKGRVQLLSNEQNVNFNGRALINPESKQLRFDDVELNFDIASFDMAQLYAAAPELKDAGIGSDLEGQVNLHLVQLIVEDGNMPAIDLRGKFREGKILLDVVGAPIEEINADLMVADDIVGFKNISAKLFSSFLKGDVLLENIFTQMSVDVDVDVDQLLIEDVLKGKGLPVDLRGVVSSGVDAKGPLTEKADLLNGNISADMAEAKLVDLNVLDVVLSKISFIPNLAEKVYANLSDKYKEKLNQKDTELKLVRINGKLGEGQVVYSVDVEADEILVYLTGVLGLDNNIRNNTHVYIPEELSASLVASVEELDVLLDQQGRLYIPFKPYDGPVDQIQVAPNLGEVTQRVIQERGKQELRNVIFKALDIEEEPVNNDPEAEPEPKEEKSLEKELIEGILNEIPLFK